MAGALRLLIQFFHYLNLAQHAKAVVLVGGEVIDLLYGDITLIPVAVALSHHAKRPLTQYFAHSVLVLLQQWLPVRQLDVTRALL